MRSSGFLLLLITAGCADILGLEPATLGQGGGSTTSSVTGGGGPGGAGSGGGGPGGGGAGAGGDAGGAGGGGGGPPAVILYVDGNEGTDTNSGLLQNEPKQTIGAALVTASDPANGITEVHVCEGVYAETLVLGAAFEALPGLAIRGGYVCSSWVIPTDYGYPTFATGTVIQPGAVNQPGVSVDAALSPGFLIDGFEIHAGTLAGLPSRGVVIDGTARVVLRNNEIHGGDGVSAPPIPASVAVDVGTAEPTIELNLIHGGTGELTGAGYAASTGVWIHPAAQSSAPMVRDNLIFGGNGVHVGGNGGMGSVGIDAVSAKPILEANAIWGGGGTFTGLGASSIGIAIESLAEAEILRNDVNGPNPPFGFGWSDSGFGPRGVTVASSGTTLDGNRIYGGPGVSSAGSQTSALEVSAAGTVITNNLLYAGNENDTGSASTLYGVVLYLTADNVKMAHNTIYAGQAAGGQDVAVHVSSGTTGLAFDKNIVFGKGAADFALRVAACNGDELSSFHDNMFFGFAAGKVLSHTGACSPIVDYSTASSAEAALAAGSTDVGGNREVSNACGGDPNCTQICATSACMSDVFDGWLGTSTGYDLLFQGGWRLQTDLVCGTWSTTFVATGVTTDFVQAPRSMPSTIGAHEQDACN